MGSIWRIDNNCGQNVAPYQVCRKRSYSGFRTVQPNQASQVQVIRKVILWVPFAVLPTLVWWWWVQWLVARQRAVWSTAQRWCWPDKDTARAVLWRGRCSLASWRWALPTQHRHHPPAWSPGSGFSFHTPPFISLLDFYCTVSFVNLELQMQNCTKWEVKQAIMKSLYCVNCDWYGNETLTEVYILYCLCLCHILHLPKSLVVAV